MIKQQKGMTLIGMLLTVILIIFLGILILRVVPVYIQHYSIIHVIKSLSSIPRAELMGEPTADAKVLKSHLYKNLEVNGIYDFKESNVIVTPEIGNKFKVTLNYKVIKPLMYNVSLLFIFSDTQEVTLASEN